MWVISSGFGPCFPLAGGLCKLYANARGKWQIQRQPHLVQYKQQANPLLSMHNYTPLVISGNDKNKQLTSLGQRKLAITSRNTLFVLKKSLEHLKNKKNGFFLKLTIHVFKAKSILWDIPYESNSIKILMSSDYKDGEHLQCRSLIGQKKLRHQVWWLYLWR